MKSRMITGWFPRPLLADMAMIVSGFGLCWLTGCGVESGLVSVSDPNGTEAMANYEAERKAEDRARAADPAWKPSESQVAVLKVDTGGKQGTVNNFCLDGEGRILVCVGRKDGKSSIDILSADGTRVGRWELETTPQAICRTENQQFLVAGAGRIYRLDKDGKVLASGKTPGADAALPPDDDLRELSKRFGDGTPGSAQEKLERLKTMLSNRRTEVSGIAAAGDDVFVACPSTRDFTYVVYRMDRNFENPKQVVDKLSGCCSQMDIQARDGKLYVANNGRHRVQVHDREGKLLTSIGKQDRKAADGFGGCCEPKNLRLLPNGEILTAESGPPVAIKRFSAEGKFLGVIATPQYPTSCVRTTVEQSPDGKHHYILNTEGASIHVFAARN